MKNRKRNGNKYRVITLLLIICMTANIVVNTYASYQTEASKLVLEYDMDTKLSVPLTDADGLQEMFHEYETTYQDPVEWMTYREAEVYLLVEPASALVTDTLVFHHANNQKSIQTRIIGLEDKSYQEYLRLVNGKEGDSILYNWLLEREENSENNIYLPVFQEKEDIRLHMIEMIPINNREVDEPIFDYRKIENNPFVGNTIITDQLLHGYQELKTREGGPATLFVNFQTFQQLEQALEENKSGKGVLGQANKKLSVKVKCNKNIEFKNWLEEKKNRNISALYYTLENQEKIIYVNLIQFATTLIVIAVMIMGMVSLMNNIQASLCEREKEIKTWYDIGASRSSMHRILGFEWLFMFGKAFFISILLAIPMVWGVIRYMENTIVFHKLLIPYAEIAGFTGILFLLYGLVTMVTIRKIK